jgi:isoquinoline 1-oxidoreductase subunit beta
MIAKDRRLDPIAFRLTLSEGQPRMQTVLRAVADSPTGRGRATAAVSASEPHPCGRDRQVSVDRATGKIKVHNFWAAIDAGLARAAAQRGDADRRRHPALGHVLREKITIRNGRVLESNYTEYEVTRMSDVPNIEIKVVSTDNPPTGAGEDGVPVVKSLNRFGASAV